MVKAIIVEYARAADYLNVSLRYNSCSSLKGQYSANLELALPPHHVIRRKKTILQLLKALDSFYYFHENNLRIDVKVMLEEDERRQQLTYLEPYGDPENSILKKNYLFSSIAVTYQNTSLPKSLKFAVLDDNLLVRRNVERTLRTFLYAHPESFVRGENLKECKNFIDEVLKAQVDVAIFDENLEFEEEIIRGSQMGKLARELGFKGCLILHSAQVEGSSSLLFDGIFDGFIEKTASKKMLANGILLAWNKHKENTSE